MTAILTGDQAGLILAQPGSDGAFSAREAKLARAMGGTRSLVMQAFAPKAAGGGEYFTATRREPIARTLGYHDVPKTWLADLV